MTNIVITLYGDRWLLDFSWQSLRKIYKYIYIFIIYIYTPETNIIYQLHFREEYVILGRNTMEIVTSGEKNVKI